MEDIKFDDLNKVDIKKIPAFPDEYNEGMTLRDYFAAKAMVLYEPREVYVHKAAKRSYELADAMLEARSK